MRIIKELVQADVGEGDLRTNLLVAGAENTKNKLKKVIKTII